MININDVLIGTIQMNKYGSAYLVSDSLKKDIYINKNNTGYSLHLDIVKIEVIEGSDRLIEGKVIEVISRFKTEFIGTIQISEGYAFFIADSQKMNIDIFIPLKDIKEANNGDKVIVELTDWKEGKKTPNGKIIKVLGSPSDSDVQSNSIIHEYDLPIDFSEDVKNEVEKLLTKEPLDELENRRDMRDVLTFTIDPDTAKDFDDAISFKPIGDNQYELGIHIADVSYYVRPGSEIDKEAYNRGTSIYLVDSVIPMLPEELSNGLCSLSPNNDKLCFSAVFNVDINGNIIKEWFGRTLINSNHRFTYNEVQTIIDNPSNVINEVFDTPSNISNPSQYPLYKISLLLLNDIAKSLRSKRDSIFFDKEEVKFVLDENNKPTSVELVKSGESNHLIEECMLLANRRVAKYINDSKVPSINRIHEEPDLDKLQSLNDYIKQFGYKLDLSTQNTLKTSINKLLVDVKDTDEENIINNLLVRSMQKALYSTDNVGHFGLSFEDYTHFTSPIRRYPDIMIHRILHRVLANKTPQKEVKLINKCQYLSNMEVRAQRASRDSIKYKQCEFLSNKIGRVFTGVVNGITNYGLFVNIKEANCEGLINLYDIVSDKFIVDLDSHSIKSKTTGGYIRLGDELMVTVKCVDLNRKTIDLNLLSIR